MTVKSLTEHHLGFQRLKGGCTSSSQSTLVKIPHCWKSHVTAQMSLFTKKFECPLCIFQLCYIMTAITICVRVDVYSVLYAVFLGLLMILSRHANAIVWPVWTIILVILLPIQFMLCLGLPLFLCYGEFVFATASPTLYYRFEPKFYANFRQSEVFFNCNIHHTS